MMTTPHRTQAGKRGFTLLIAILLASVSLLVGLALADVAYKQVVLSSTARNSQIAFYRADSALECALYYDQQFAAFNIGNTFDQSAIRCEDRAISGYDEQPLTGGGVRTTFDVMCEGGGRSAAVAIYKEGSGTCGATGEKNCLYASGFNTCTESDPIRFERGLKAVY